MLKLEKVVIADENNQIGFDQFKQFMWIAEHEGAQVMKGIFDVRGKKCAICGRTWENTAKDITNQHSPYGRNTLVHETCFVGHLAQVQFDLLQDALSANSILEAGEIKEIANQYGGAWNTPWWKVKIKNRSGFKIGITFGRRKRVYVIHATPLGGTKFALNGSEFKEEIVTKEIDSDYVMIHAWTNEKVKEYIKTITELTIA